MHDCVKKHNVVYRNRTTNLKFGYYSEYDKDWPADLSLFGRSLRFHHREKHYFQLNTEMTINLMFNEINYNFSYV